MSDEPRSSYEATIRDLLASGKLKFPSVLERIFRVDFYQRSVAMIRVALGLGFFLYTSFGVLDAVLAPETYRRLWIIRFAFIDPILIIVFVLTFFPFFRVISQPALSFVALSSGLGIVLMMAFLGDSAIALSYYAGLILVLMWTYAFTRISFRYATVTGWTIIVAFWLVSIYYQGVLETPQTTAVFISNNFFFIAANIMGMIVSYLFERSVRKEFLQRQLIAESQRSLERERNELRRRNTIMEEELSMARSIQQQLIPQDVPLDRMAAVYRPMQAVGGDYFDFFRFEGREGRVGIFMSDVAGHGVPAALIASMVKSLLAGTRSLLGNPSRLLNHLNDVLLGQTRQRFVTAFYCIYDRPRRRLVWSTAGQTFPLLITKSEVSRIQTEIRHVPLAFIDEDSLINAGVEYKDYVRELPPEAKLLLYTDGLLEVPSKDDSTVQFADVLDEVLMRLSDLDPEAFVAALVSELVTFCGREDLPDDVCVICLAT